ncbi:MAG: fibrillarin-like rRNA/tRNA 2'-O-methyltransferase, partial [Promethearchaeota archaeon]
IVATQNLTPGVSIYGEKLFPVGESGEYREWKPIRSKLCAYFLKRGKEYHFKKGISVLYLGAANGTTVSHVSDLVGESSRIYAVEFSARSLRELVQRLESRRNVLPILADATQPSQYRSLIPEQVDLIYQDVAQPNQAELLLENIEMFLKHSGYFYVAIKARSIDVLKDPGLIFEGVRAFLEKKGCEILDMKDLSPFSEDHVMFVGRSLG